MNNNKNTNRIFPFYKKGRFYNSDSEKPESFLFQTLPGFLSSLHQRKKRLPENKSLWIVPHAVGQTSVQPVVTWIGHATFLIQSHSINILTDPIFGNASSFFPRILPPGIPLPELPPIDIVLLSHNHPDHCDLATLHALRTHNPGLILLVPHGDRHWLEKKGFRVAEHQWHDQFVHPKAPALACTFLPAHHWSGQGLFDKNKSLWGSWMISSATVSGQAEDQPHHIYFGGDTAYSTHFSYIASHYPAIDVALMPIAPVTPHPWMRKSHMDAQEAVKAFSDLNARHFVPMHWGTFQFGLDTFQGPLDQLMSAWQEHEMEKNNKKISVLKVGQSMRL